jgi:hypothetical protein
MSHYRDIVLKNQSGVNDCISAVVVYYDRGEVPVLLDHDAMKIATEPILPVDIARPW